MSRPTIKELFDLDAKSFIGMSHEIVLKMKIDAILERKRHLSNILHEAYTVDNSDYDNTIAKINKEIKYLDKTYDGIAADMEEMGVHR